GAFGLFLHKGSLTVDGIRESRRVGSERLKNKDNNHDLRKDRTGRGTSSSSAAHAVAVTVQADPARLDSLLDSIDFGAIAATVAR
ncbi:MAG TPA: hypothetical protein VL546_11000, partial [Steroidobacteraceae bacterium]|nr:hypothetical protein [Steroidobacteraceae bacterium]